VTAAYLYRMMQRPPDPGAIPRKGLLLVTGRIGGVDDDRGHWGYAVYDRELKKEETKHYDMERVTEYQE